MPGRGGKAKPYLLEEHQLPEFRAKSPQKMGKRRRERARARAERNRCMSPEEPAPKMLRMYVEEGEKQGK